MIEATPNCW